MIVYLNMTGRRMKADELIEALEMVQGQTVTGKYELNSKFSIIKLKHNKNGKNPLTVKGFQDTRITAHDDGTTAVEHGAPGMGSLRFEADRYMNRVARIARTEHNMAMLAYAWRDDQWKIVDPVVADEVKLAHDKWWRGLPELERKEVLERERLGKLTPHHVPARWSQHGDLEVEAMVKDSAAKDEELAKLREIVASMESKLKTSELRRTTEEKPEAAPPIPEKPLEQMKAFELYGVLRRMGVTVDRKWSCKYCLELIAAEKAKKAAEAA